MRTLAALVLALVVCAAAVLAQSGSGSAPASGSGSGVIAPPPPTEGGLIDVSGAPVEVVVPALLHESLIMKATGQNFSAALVNDTFLNVSAALQLPFKGVPVATNDSIGIGLIVMPGNASAAPLTSELMRESVFPARDMEAMLSEANANVIMSNLWTSLDRFAVHYALPFDTSALQLLLPEVYAACAGCPLSVDAYFSQVPTAFFNQSASFVFADLVGSMNAAGPNGSVPMLELLFNGTIALVDVTVDNATSALGIQLDVPNFVASVNRTVIGSVSNGLMVWLAQALVTRVLVEELNSQWQSLGVAIPMFGKAKVTALDHELVNGTLNIGADLELPAAAPAA